MSDPRSLPPSERWRASFLTSEPPAAVPEVPQVPAGAAPLEGHQPRPPSDPDTERRAWVAALVERADY